MSETDEDSHDESPVQPYIDALEWEPLRHEFNGPVTRIGTNAGQFGNLVIRRDPEYRVAATLVANGRSEWLDKREEVVPGTMGGGVEVAVSVHGQERVVLPRALMGRWNHHWQPNKETTTIEVSADEVIWKSDRNVAPALHVDWFISGPEASSVALWRITKRRLAASFTRRRAGMRSETTEHEFVSEGRRRGTSEASSRDYLSLTLPDGPVRVCQVPDEYAPAWTRPLSIEYTVGAEPPSEEYRRGIVEALGFLFGRHMLRVGTTVFDSAGLALRQEAISPWGHDVIRTARQPDRPTVPIFAWEMRDQTEGVLSSITAAYLAARDELNLSHAVWTMWMASRMAVSFETPLYAAALETVMQGWFASGRSETKAIYMAADDFQKTFAEAIEKFRKTAEGVKYGDRIVRKISGANAMSVNERFEVFFDEIKLPVGEGENAVIRARNLSAHGTKSRRHPHDQVVLGLGYRRLLNRVILKLLGFRGQYIDYSTKGHPLTDLDVPIGYRSRPKA